MRTVVIPTSVAMLAESENDNEEGSVVEVTTTPDGFKWVDISDKANITEECKKMRCGPNPFIAIVNKGNNVFFLRDKKDMPHVVMAYSPKIREILHMVGKGNSFEISPKYKKHITVLKKRLKDKDY